MITGSFVEGLYISTGLIKSYPKNVLSEENRSLVLTPLIRVVVQQEKSVAELLSMLKSVEQTDPVVGIVKDLEALDKTYKELDIEKHIKENHADLILSDKNLIGITEIVERIRKNITQ